MLTTHPKQPHLLQNFNGIVEKDIIASHPKLIILYNGYLVFPENLF